MFSGVYTCGAIASIVRDDDVYGYGNEIRILWVIAVDVVVALVFYKGSVLFDKIFKVPLVGEITFGTKIDNKKVR